MPWARLSAERDLSRLRYWRRSYRAITPEKLPNYLGFFQFLYNARLRGKALFGPLSAALAV